MLKPVVFYVRTHLRRCRCFLHTLCLSAVLFFAPNLSFAITPDYIPLEYIESNGTQIIYTGAYAQTGSIVEVDYQITSDIPRGEYEWQAIYSSGSGGAGWPGHMFGLLLTLRTKRYSVYYEGITDVYDSAIDTNRHIVRQESEKFYIDGNLLYTRPTANFTNSSPVMLFNRAGENLYMMGRIYSAKIWSDGTNLSFNGIPAKRKSDGAIGMYDTVSGNFFENAGTGTFIAGPELYTFLDYIESTGTQHIDLGEDVYLQTGSIIEVDYQITADNPNQNEGWQSIYSNDTGGAPYPLGYVGHGVSTRIKQYSYYYNNKVHVSDSTVDMNRHIIRQDGEKFYRDGNLVYTHPTSNFTNPSHIWLFSRPGNAGNLSVFGKLYGAKVWSDGTNLSFNGFPAKRNSDGAIGMYDAVSGQFFENAGTGTFTAGSEVPTICPDYANGVPVGYRVLEYIESTGTQYILTDINYSSSDVLETILEVTDLSSTKHMIQNTYIHTPREGTFFQIAQTSTLLIVDIHGDDSGDRVSTSSITSLNNKVTVKVDGTAVYINGDKIGNAAHTMVDNNYTLRLFAAQYGDGTYQPESNIRIYSE